ncbi:MAG: helix-turn-helix domain-containing protein [Chloroflexota bacterium]|nr:helix-turn-helix domain-containing protein [Chloroflexota bacterium]
MTVENGSSFDEWLRTQLERRRLSQRQLAERSGVNHSTISRLLTGERRPTLATATKLVRALGGAVKTPPSLLEARSASSPTARVEHALRADELLGQPETLQVMRYYLSLRKQRLGTAEGDDVSPAGQRRTSGSPDDATPS